MCGPHEGNTKGSGPAFRFLLVGGGTLVLAGIRGEGVIAVAVAIAVGFERLVGVRLSPIALA